MKKTYGYDLDRSVKCSNYIGDTIDMAVELGFQKMLLTGHIGKLIKVSGGIMNTHSKEADCRMELLAAFAARAHMRRLIPDEYMNLSMPWKLFLKLEELSKNSVFQTHFWDDFGNK